MCNFLTIWAVLSVLLNTVDSQLQYVQALQHIYNTHYETCTPEAMEHLEQQSMDIRDMMCNDCNKHTFDRVSGADGQENTSNISSKIQHVPNAHSDSNNTDNIAS